MSSSTIWFILDIGQRMLTIPFSLFAALMLPDIFYASSLTRSLTLAVIAFETAYVLQPHEITDIIILYLMGFGAILFFVWSAVMLLCCNPIQDFRRLRRIQIRQEDAKSRVKYDWEAYPAHFGWKRTAWVFDLLFNLRGIGWSFRKPCYPVPDDIKKLYEDNGVDFSNNVPVRANTIRGSSFLQEQLFQLMTRYLLVDLCITFMDVSTFFQASRPPLEWVFPITVRTLIFFPYNTFLAAIGVYAVLDLYGTCIAIVLVGLVGPKVIGTWGDSFMYPRLWGSLVAVWDGGLVGFWSIMWHDLFKHAFLTFTRGLISRPNKPDPSTLGFKIRKFCRLHVIFFVSGVCHATASYTQAVRTYPILTLIAFTAQGLGISIQQILASLLGQSRMTKSKSKSIIVVFGIIWTYFTMYIFLGDLAASGAFQLKLVPVSIVGLILGRRWPGWIGS